MKSYNKTFYFIRHGETDWNKDRIYQGQNDIPLNETGRNQAFDRAQNMSNAPVDAIFSSPLSRARETANIINKSYPDANITDVPELMESQSIAAAKYVLELENIQNFPSFEKMPESNETPESFIARIKKGLASVLLNSETNNPLIIAHGGVSAALCKILDVPVIQTPNCCLLKFESINGNYRGTQI